MPIKDGHWLAILKLYPPPEISFSAAKKMKIARTENGMRTPTFEKKISDPNLFLLLFRLFLSKILSRRYQLSRTKAILLKKVENFSPKLMRFPCVSGEKIGTILSRRSRLSRTSRAPSRLIRPRLIDCDGGPKQTMKNPSFWPIRFFRTSPTKVFSKGPPSSADLHSKRSPSPWPGGQYSRYKCWPKK